MSAMGDMFKGHAICERCGGMVLPGTPHICPQLTGRQPLLTPDPEPPSPAERMAVALERIADILEAIVTGAAAGRAIITTPDTPK